MSHGTDVDLTARDAVATGLESARPASAPARRLMIAALVVSVLAPASYFLAAAFAEGRHAAVSAAPLLQSPCAVAQEHSLPLPTTVPPAQFVDFEKAVLAFLQSGEYERLGWCRDKGSARVPLRDTGPFIRGVYYGTHPAVRVHYSPRVMEWLLAGRVGPLPDGAMIIKEQYRPPRTRYSGLSDDRLPRVVDWTVMIKDAKGAKDGWFWGEFFDEMRFDDDQPPFQYPWAGFALYCLRCHGAAEAEHTFASLDNVKGFPGWPIAFADDFSWRLPRGADPARATPVPPTPVLPARQPDPAFLRTFTAIPGVPLSSVQTLPSETYDHVPAPPAGGRYISSSQCMSCHGGLNGPFGPTMFLPSPMAPPGTIAGANISPYGEWRWSPMGLAGRDPIFFAQVESEHAFLGSLPPSQGEPMARALTNACVSCHGAMGQRQLAADTHGEGDFTLDLLQLTDRSDPRFIYGALARDGISCAVCHRMIPAEAPAGVTSLEHFLETSITGGFQVAPPDTIFGPYRDTEISPYIMTNAIGITPRFGSYLQSSRMCGSCHTIDLPVVDGAPGQRSLEQVTYLEWLNSRYQTEFGVPGPEARTCQHCHMPGHYHSETKGIRADRLVQKMAIVQDQDYPEALNSAPDSQLAIAVRDDFKRHELLGLNVFLLEMFNQFNDVLGVRTSDYMSGSSTDLPDAIANAARQAQERTATIRVSARVTGPQSLDADVVITNLAGHRFPSGVGFRRAFIELLVFEDRRDASGPVWASGRTNSLGVIVDGDGRALPSEFFTDYRDARGRVQQHYQPHYQVITSPSEVQIYEELNTNAEGRFTTSFIRRNQTVKDNRLLPIGWTARGPDPSLNGRYLASTHAEHVGGDPDYEDGQGTDRITYRVTLPPGVDPARCSVHATLYYQAVPPSYLSDRFQAAPNGAATQRLYYLASHLKLEGTPAENWKLQIGSARAATRTTRGQ